MLYFVQCHMCTHTHTPSLPHFLLLPQIHELYEDFHITECPLMFDEVRGREKVEQFAKLLLRDTPTTAATSTKISNSHSTK